MAKANKCCRCGKGLRHDEAIYATKDGVLTLHGTPWCIECFSNCNADQNEEDWENDAEDNV